MNNQKQGLDVNTKKIIVVMAIVIIALMVVILVPKKEKATVNEPVPEIVTPTSTEVVTVNDAVSDKFRTEVPANTSIPNTDTKLSEEQKKEIAIPTAVIPSSPGASSQFRTFDIKAEGGKFVPNKIIVGLGDIVHINFTAVDKDYDIVFPSYNMKQTARSGQTKILEFSAMAEGNFSYYCELCGGPNSTAKGNIMVVK